ncbi:MAG: hypothetical protein NY202_04585 [Mollicutes bacterium UO1]
MSCFNWLATAINLAFSVGSDSVSSFFKVWLRCSSNLSILAFNSLISSLLSLTHFFRSLSCIFCKVINSSGLIPAALALLNKVSPIQLIAPSAPIPATPPAIATGISVQVAPPVKKPPKKAAPAPNNPPHMIFYCSSKPMERKIDLNTATQIL